ncbi:CinA family protein [Pseudokineococcus sp. 1T1Z-3]|uniref:CinA family protein n=1 Tax=Pseudokineococcus sp. 1T1Z-3 TaxID=3132745 RepID=UPI0030950758
MTASASTSRQGAGGDPFERLARRCLDAARAAGVVVATAESLTAGLVSARLATVAGASEVLRGGVVAYAPAVKVDVLGVAQEMLDEHGPVHVDVALAMADGARRLLGADVAVATTGVAGPGPADGHPAGTLVVAVTGVERPLVRVLHLDGDRSQVRAGAAAAALGLLAAALGAPQEAGA